ncbi:beta-phosphoglucomutase [Convivina intestini]|uniref:beta-phosphoglucomutase n=1 Tax=Convivina intestini TaxID=1505726 RepID=UPI00200FB339|nr:beta-phosphoglucomutase [Convivina intestini]CAH1853242.1 Beta-phosphoglucomutase [Convivina intestini]
MVKFSEIKGFTFDMDGVLADTAKFHTVAWRQLAEKLGVTWNDDLQERLKGIDRMGSLNMILAEGNLENQYSQEQKEALAAEKNDNYRQLISTLTPSDVLPGMQAFLDSLKANGYLMSVASASKNAPFILDKLGLADYFVGVVDPASLHAGKPDPEIFVRAGELLKLAPEQLIGLEDSAAGIQSINGAGQTSLGIGNPQVLSEADLNFESTAEVTLAAIQAKLG